MLGLYSARIKGYLLTGCQKNMFKKGVFLTNWVHVYFQVLLVPVSASMRHWKSNTSNMTLWGMTSVRVVLDSAIGDTIVIVT